MILTNAKCPSLGNPVPQASELAFRQAGLPTGQAGPSDWIGYLLNRVID